MRICFIDPPHTFLMQERTQPPLGIMYMSAVLQAAGHDPVVSRPTGDDPEHWLTEIPEADVYGISATSLGYSIACEIVRTVREARPGAVFFLGGYHVTCEPDAVVADGLWDAICTGEGEITILQMLRDFEAGQLQQRYRGESPPDLDALPFPARVLLPDQGTNIFNYDKHYTENGMSTVILSSRGCPFTCVFCGTNAMWGRKVRYRGAPSLVEEIRECIDQFGIREFRFSDELFTTHKRRTIDLMRAMAPLDVHFKCSTRVDRVDRETLEALKAGGCREIAFGVESADPRVLKYIDKNTSVEQIETALRLCADVGIETRVLLMIGTPGEMPDTPEINIDFLERVPYDCASLTVFMPLPGSPAWVAPEACEIEILSRDLDRYNIYLWSKGKPDFNRNDDVVRLKSITPEQQRANTDRMVGYFMENGKMNEISKAKQQIAAAFGDTHVDPTRSPATTAWAEGWGEEPPSLASRLPVIT